MTASGWWANPPTLVTKGEFARDCEVTPGAVSQWVARGLPVLPCGRLDYAAAADWVFSNLDPGRATRAVRVARDMRRFLVAAQMERRRLRAALLVLSAAVAAAARQAGMTAADAAALADRALSAAVPLVNEIVVDFGAEPLAPPPAGVWRAADGLIGETVLDLVPDRGD